MSPKGYSLFTKCVISVSVILSQLIETGSNSCQYTSENARASSCDYRSYNRDACVRNGCCWDTGTNNTNLRCYKSECKPGFWGWNCRFQCQCKRGKKPCDRFTGECPSGCPSNKWGVGCLLDNMCTYNDEIALHYMGKKSRTKSGKTCRNWTSQNNYKDDDFPDNSKASARNYCRNPTDHNNKHSGKTWCYYNILNKWDYCTLRECPCLDGRFGINCAKECHCLIPTENCNNVTGACPYGCDSKFQGNDCQECVNGRFGRYCQFTCNCLDSSEICNKSQGHCVSGCKADYAGDGCRYEKPRLTRPPFIAGRGANKITVQWNAWQKPTDRGDGPISKYLVYYMLLHGGQNWTYNKDAKNKTRLTLRGLEKATEYQVKIIPVHKGNFNGHASPVVTTSTCGKPLSGPVGLSIPGGFHRVLPDNQRNKHGASEEHRRVALNVTWEPPSDDQLNCDSVKLYKVYIKQPRYSDFKWHGNVTIQKITIQVQDMYTNYTIGVSVVNNGGLESEMSLVTQPGKSGPVQDLSVVKTTSNSVTIRWNPPLHSNGPIHSYGIHYIANNVSNCDVESYSPGSPATVDAAVQEFTIPRLHSFSKYLIQVWAVTEAKKGLESEIEVTTNASVPNGTVKRLEVSQVGIKEAMLTWQPPDCETWNNAFKGFKYDVRQKGKPSTTVISGSINETKVELEDLIPDTTYLFQVWLFNHVGDGPKTYPKELTTREDKPCLFGNHRECTFKCHCKWDQLCDERTGNCTNGCGSGWPPQFSWRGEGCQIGNVAYRKPAEQSSVYRDDAGMYGPHNAVDGDTNPDVYERHCIHTDPDDSNVQMPWWRVDLGDLHDIYNVTIFNRAQYWPSRRTEYFHVIISSELNSGQETICFNYTNTLRESASVTLTCKDAPVTGRYVTIKRYHGYELKILNICEVVIEGHRHIDCSSCPSSQCSTVVGCESCPAGKQLPDCKKDCQDKFYGINCDQKCGHCRGGLPCDLKVGSCKRGCQLWWTGETCMLQIDLPSYQSLVANASAVSVKETSIEIQFQQINIRRKDLASHYFYVVEYRESSKTENWSKSNELSHNNNSNVGRTTITKLAPYTKYRFRVIPYRRHNDRTEAGHTSEISKEIQTSAKSTGSDNTALIAGVIVAVVVVLLIIILVVFLLRRRKRKSPAKSGDKAKVQSEISEDITDGIQLPECEYENWNSAVNIKENTTTVKLADLADYIAQREKEENSFKSEYQKLAEGEPSQCVEGSKPANIKKNRFMNIIAYDHTRVILENKEGADPNLSYINASYIKRYKDAQPPYIASQGPKPDTVTEMWRMIWQENSNRIVMITNVVELGKKKSERYWPEGVGSSEVHGGIKVQMEGEEEFADYTIRIFLVSNEGQESRVVRQFHFTSWPDKSALLHAFPLLAFRKKVKSYEKESTGPLIIHCSAGVGRTGTYIAVEYLIEQAENEGQVDVYKCVERLREQRTHMVQTLDQYKFVHHAVLEGSTAGSPAIPCDSFNKTREVMYRDPSHFQNLSLFDKKDNKEKDKEGNKPENKDKNRFSNIIPSNSVRPYLYTGSSGMSNYINAVFLDGFKKKDAFIITQMPLPNTVVDLWRLLGEYSRTIVMLNPLDESNKTCVKYWPDSDEPTKRYGPVEVQLLQSTTNANATIVSNDFSLTLSGQEPVTVRQFQLLSWKSGQTLPKDREALLDLRDLVLRWQQRSGNEPITVHCMNGVSRSGLFYVACYALEKMDIEQEVDIALAIKHARVARPQIIENMEQYRCLYDLVDDYMRRFEMYANFR